MSVKDSLNTDHNRGIFGDRTDGESTCFGVHPLKFDKYERERERERELHVTTSIG